MDPISHSLVGALAGKSVKASNRRVWIMALLGSAPDLDVLANGLGQWAYFLQHRGITHSIVGLVIQTLLFSWILSRVDRGRFWTRSFHYFLPLFLHVVGDTFTAYGVPWLAPFSFQSFSWDLFEGVTLLPMVATAAGLWWLKKKTAYGWKEPTFIWASWVIYLGLSFTGKATAAKLADIPANVRFEALPSTMNPFAWRGIYQDETQTCYRAFSVNLLNGQKTSDQRFSFPLEDVPLQASLKSKLVQTFLANHRWPLAKVTVTPEGWRVDWGTVLFSSRGSVRGKVAVFVLPDGSIKEEKHTFEFWDPA